MPYKWLPSSRSKSLFFGKEMFPKDCRDQKCTVPCHLLTQQNMKRFPHPSDLSVPAVVLNPTGLLKALAGLSAIPPFPAAAPKFRIHHSSPVTYKISHCVGSVCLTIAEVHENKVFFFWLNNSWDETTLSRDRRGGETLTPNFYFYSILMPDE